jgi:hypothetical protein
MNLLNHDKEIGKNVRNFPLHSLNPKKQSVTRFGSLGPGARKFLASAEKEFKDGQPDTEET